MKRSAAIFICLVLMATPALAKPKKAIIINNNTTNITKTTNVHKDVVQHNTLGAKADAPNLIRFTEDLTLGVEGGKDIAKNLFYPDDYDYYEADKGYFGYVKVTYTGTLFDLSK